MKRDIPGHAGFKATSDGKIIGKRGKEMTGHIDRCGYREVVLSENGTSKNHLAHRLIVDTFIPNPHKLPFVNHKDGKKLLAKMKANKDADWLNEHRSDYDAD